MTPGRSRWPLLAGVLALGAGAAAGAPKLTYSSLEAEAATEYQVGWERFGPGYLRLIGKAEVALTDDLTAKAVISPCLGPYSSEPEGVTQCSTARLVEELTLAGLGTGFDYSLGRQVITVGNTEGFVLLDRFNGRDLCRFARLDTQNKLPNWIARGRAFVGAATLTATFAPYSAEAEFADPGSYCADEFNSPGRFADLGDPKDASGAGWAGGAELALTYDSWGATLNVISTREDLFVLETFPVLEKTRPRTLWLGGTASATLGAFVLRGEVAYAPDRQFTMSPQSVGALAMQGIGTNGIDERWNLLAVAGVETRKDDWYWVLQYFEERVGDGPALVRDQESQMMSLRVRRTFANDRLAVDSFAVLDLDYRDFALRASVAYELSEETKVELGGTAYSESGGQTGFFGSYAGRESLYLKLSRSLW